MGGRFLNKRFTIQDGFSQGPGDETPAAFFEADSLVINRPLKVEGLITGTMGIVGSMTTGPLKVLGNITATAVTLNAGTIGSMTITNLLAGAFTATAVAMNAGTIGSMTITNLLNGAQTGTASVFATATAGSANFDNLRVGASAGNNLATAMWRTTYTWNMGAIAGVYGSTNAVITQDVAMSGVALTDTVIAHPVASLDLNLHWAAAVFSADNVNIKAWYTGSTGALTPGNVPFKITAIKI